MFPSGHLDTVQEYVGPILFHSLPITPQPSMSPAHQQKEQQLTFDPSMFSPSSTSAAALGICTDSAQPSAPSCKLQSGLRRSAASRYGAAPPPSWMQAPHSSRMALSSVALQPDIRPGIGSSQEALLSLQSTTSPLVSNSQAGMQPTAEPSSMKKTESPFSSPFTCVTPWTAASTANTIGSSTQHSPPSSLHPSVRISTAAAEGGPGIVSGFTAASRHTRRELDVFDGIHITARPAPTLTPDSTRQQRSASIGGPVPLLFEDDTVSNLPASSLLGGSASLLAWPQSIRTGSASLDPAFSLPRIPISLATSTSSDNSTVGWGALLLSAFSPPSAGSTPNRAARCWLPETQLLPPAPATGPTPTIARAPDPSTTGVANRTASEVGGGSVMRFEERRGLTLLRRDSSVSSTRSEHSAWGSAVSSSLDAAANIASSAGSGMRSRSRLPSHSLPVPDTSVPRQQQLLTHASTPAPV